MFDGKDNGYDSYNEKEALRYDDDYIAPSEEYRSESVQSYEDDISTYSYGEDNERMRSILDKYLEKGEKLLWFGSKGGIRVPSEGEMKKRKVGSWIIGINTIVFLFGLCFLPLCYFLPLLAVNIALYMWGGNIKSRYKVPKAFYALTDKRFFGEDLGSFTSVYYTDITKMNLIVKGDDFGDVHFTTTKSYDKDKRVWDGPFDMVMSDVAEPVKVRDIFEKNVKRVNVLYEQKVKYHATR